MAVGKIGEEVPERPARVSWKCRGIKESYGSLIDKRVRLAVRMLKVSKFIHVAEEHLQRIDQSLLRVLYQVLSLSFV